MAALLVGLAVMAVMMGMMLPVWSHMVQREKEEELIFRGQQYARAIGLFQRKFANTPPPSIDVLVEQRFLRKKYKDPITNDDFQPIYANQAAMSVSAPSAARTPGQLGTTQLATPPTAQVGGAQISAGGPIIGVTSKSKETSIKLYNGRDKYNEWAFIYLQTAQRIQGPGGLQPGKPGTQVPGGQQPFGMGIGSGRGGPNGIPNGFGGGPNGQPNRPPIPGQGFGPNGPGGFNQPFGPGGQPSQPFQPGTPFGQPVQPGGMQPGVIRPPSTRPPGR